MNHSLHTLFAISHTPFPIYTPSRKLYKAFPIYTQFHHTFKLCTPFTIYILLHHIHKPLTHSPYTIHHLHTHYTILAIRSYPPIPVFAFIVGILLSTITGCIAWSISVEFHSVPLIVLCRENNSRTYCIRFA